MSQPPQYPQQPHDPRAGQQPGYPPPGYPPAPQAQPGAYPPPPPGAAGAPAPPTGHARIHFEASFFWMMWMLFFTGPTVTVDGRPYRAGWGRTPIDVPAGPHHVEVHTRYLWKVGKAETRLNLAPGQQVPLYYRPPALLFMAGALGHQPQRTPGMVPALILAIGLPALIFLCACLSLAANDSGT